jgi:3-phosphoshikimate 1-carboxyvinyltransferase
MIPLLVKPALRLQGEIVLLGDKSIAHRSVIISAISYGKTTIENFPNNKDCLSTVKALKKLGIKITQKNSKTSKTCSAITILGKGLRSLSIPKAPIFVGDSGTTLRLLLGVLAGQNFKTKLRAGKSLSQRPMLRVTAPLRMMGADIAARHKPQDIPRLRLGQAKIEEYPPITIKGGNLKPITYKMPVASAQVKSAILLAGLYAEGKTKVIESIKTRDHTERILKLFKADIKLKQNTIVMKGNKELVSPARIYIPGDISSASFFIVLAAILPDSYIIIKDVSLNPSRTGIIRVLKRMGVDIRITSYQLPVTSYEPAGDIIVKSSRLRGALVKKEEIPALIDELPILMVAACKASGITVFEGVSELRVKETDRIRSMCGNLKKMGADIRIFKENGQDKVVIKGVKELNGNRISSFGDHRTAMSMVVAGLVAGGETLIDDINCINKSFPVFFSFLKNLIRPSHKVLLRPC